MPHHIPLLPIFFAAHRPTKLEDLTGDARFAIFLTPETNWKNGTRFSLSVFNTSRWVIEHEQIFLAYQVSTESNEAFRRHDGPAYQIREGLRTSKREFISAKELPAFFTLMTSLAGYRSVVRAVGSQDAISILLRINDMVAVANGGKFPPWFRKASFGKVFNFTFLRDSETFFAFNNAAPILKGLEFEELESITTDYRLVFTLPSFPNAHKLAVSFLTAPPLPNRITVIIGKNGVGKSQTLFHFAKALLGDTRELTNATGDRPQINRLIVVTSPGETRNTFPPMRKSARINYRRLHLSRSQWGKNEPGLGDVLIQLARSREGIKGQSRWELFIEALSTAQPPEEIFVRRRASQERQPVEAATSAPFPITHMIVGDEEERLSLWESIAPREDLCRFVDNRILPLSSGQITFLRFAAHACLYIENGTLLLFDEPETHLHPNLITQFVRLLDKLLELSGSLAVVATHSAYLVREVPRSQVIILREGEGRTIEVVTPRLRTLGADIGEISHFVFGDELFGRLLELVRFRLKQNPQEADGFLKSMESDLSSEAWMNLRRELSGGGAAQ